MKGSQLITLDFLKAHDACAEGLREFGRVFPDGGEYQQVLDRCADEDRMDFAQWLMNVCGPSGDVRTFDDDIDEPDKNIAFAGTLYFKKGANVKRILAGEGIKAGCDIEAGWGIKAGCGIEAGCGIKAGCGIEAGEGIKAGCDIKAGWGIKAGEGIKAGCDIKAGEGIKAGCDIEAGWGIKAGEEYGVFAGLSVAISQWPQYAVVTAQTEPDNLISGHWKELESC